MVLLPLLVIAVGVLGLMWWQFSKIERVDVSSVLTSGSGGTNYLIVGTDSREGIEETDPNSGAFLGEAVDGQRTDTIMLLRIEGDRSMLMSIPRDLWVTNPATGEPGRINATFRSGPANLITAVENLGVPVDHYMEINFVSFGELVDALGGITVEIPFPARDTHSGLDLPQSGTITLTGDQALAYVRSRFYEELIDGQWVAEGTGDLGRVTRQQQFLQGLLSKAGSVRNPLTAKDMVGALSVGLRIDDTISFFDALKLGWTFGNLDLETVELPTTPRTTDGGAQVLDLAEPDAGLALSQMGSSGATPTEPGGG
jgi:LCP family protein required for cell wall assembly